MLFIFIIFSSINAAEPIAAANILGNGFDYKSGTYSLAPIFLFTYTSNMTWTSPYSNKVYNIPDQMFVHSLDEVFEKVTESMSESYSEFYESFIRRYTFSVGIDIKAFGLGFNYDRQMGFIKDSMEQDYAEITHGTHFWAYNIASLYPQYMLQLHPMLQIAINKFPRKITTQQDILYATEFTQTFGQFFVYRSAFGAQLDFNIAISKELTKNYDKEWMFTQAGLSFHYYLFNVSAGGFENRTDIHIDTAFLAQTNANTTFYGGDPTLADINKLSAWVRSIDQNLYPLNSTFIPIWTVVSDPIKQTSMKNFMIAYLKGI